MPVCFPILVPVVTVQLSRNSVLFCLLILMAIQSGCKRNWHYIPYSFDQEVIPPAPDYDDATSWAALPDRWDLADSLASAEYQDGQRDASCDVFFIHPTTFFEKDARWTAPLSDDKVNSWTDNGPLLHQASVFNGSCRVYAPRYRQAHIKSYLHPAEGGDSALALAYRDVKTAFRYYLEHYSQGRPIVIGAHSQGTTHAIRLIKECIEGTELADRVVCAYLVGMEVKPDEFRSLPPCAEAGDFGCFVSWMTFDKGHFPNFYDNDFHTNVIHNPITWTRDSVQFSTYEQHRRILTSKHVFRYPKSMSAKPHRGMLWVKKPKVPVLKHFVTKKNWHVADYNLFWENIRQNVDLRCSEYLQKHGP